MYSTTQSDSYQIKKDALQQKISELILKKNELVKKLDKLKNNSNNINNDNNNNSNSNKSNKSKSNEKTMKQFLMDKINTYSYNGTVYRQSIENNENNLELLKNDILKSSNDTQLEMKSLFFQLYGISVHNNNSKWYNINENENTTTTNTTNTANNNKILFEKDQDSMLVRFDTFHDNEYQDHYFIKLQQQFKKDDSIKQVSIIENTLPYWIPVTQIAQIYLHCNQMNFNLFCESIHTLLYSFNKRKQEYLQIISNIKEIGIQDQNTNESYTRFEFKILPTTPPVLDSNIQKVILVYDSLSHIKPSKLMLHNHDKENIPKEKTFTLVKSNNTIFKKKNKKNKTIEYNNLVQLIKDVSKPK